ncbi:MAG: potassium transporter TrkG [Planctomycetota bacterium]
MTTGPYSRAPRSLVALGVAATLSLLSEAGWALAPPKSTLIDAGQWAIALLYAVLLRRAALESSETSLSRLRVLNIIRMTLAIGTGCALVACLPPVQRVLPHGPSALLDVASTIVAVSVALRSIVDLAAVHDHLLARAPRVELFLVGGFLALVGVGTALLMMPRMSTGARIPFIDALFTSTSASCVTGLGVLDTGADLSLRGQVVLATLFQVGGLGIVTFIAFGSVLAGRQFSVQHLVNMRTLVQVETMAGVRKQVMFLVGSALCIEALGALALYVALPGDAALSGSRAWWSVFHSISAFCNAGFSLEHDSLVGLRSAFGVNAAVIGLFVVGGLGAPVMRELVRLTHEHARRHLQRNAQPRYIPPMTIQARLALVPTLVLLPLGALVFWLMERHGALAGMPSSEAFVASVFQSATPRTAGFATLDFGAFSDATLLFLTGLMVVGASPMSTGGGIKTATIMVLLITIRAAATGREEVEYRGRVIARAAVRTALSVLLIYIASAALGVLALSLTDAQVPLRDRIFETVSARSTTGLSTGVTATWSTAGKLILCGLMFAGRIGPATLMLGAFRPTRQRARFRYPTAPVILG